MRKVQDQDKDSFISIVTRTLYKFTRKNIMWKCQVETQLKVKTYSLEMIGFPDEIIDETENYSFKSCHILLSNRVFAATQRSFYLYSLELEPEVEGSLILDFHYIDECINIMPLTHS